MKYMLPQEIQVWYILPVIRKEFSRILVKEKGLTQKEAAKILSITEGAISQYLNSKRGTTIKFNEILIDEIRKSTDIIYNNPKRIISETIRILELKETWKAICEFHKKNDNNIELDCAICKNGKN
jgi:uncharacterized protein